VGRLIDRWRGLAPALEPAALALALSTTAYCVETARRSQTLELVWTGPPSAIPLRRTDQVLLDLIGQSQGELLLVTFAVYDIPDIRQALIAAAERGVRLHLIIESPQESAGKVAYDGLRALGHAVAARAQVYRWPLEKRPRAASGKHGSLHAKCAVADETTLFISSANLTDYALTLNMEMGLLVRGGPLPGQVRRHFQRLMDLGIVIAIN
jgi:phosphatidylserine/phosphatidylglycerophosphate/cardiolipin synthase-like enzyme